MVHCAECGILWDAKDGLFLIEADRVLKPGGYFVLHGSSLSTKKGSMSSAIEEVTQKICWTFIAQQEDTFIWQKTTNAKCSIQGAIPPCTEEREDAQSYYQPLASCVGGTRSKRWVPIQNRSSSSQITPDEFEIYGIRQDELYEDFDSSLSALRNYWSLLTPLIFSDHPKRPGDEDPLPPYNMLRNVMDMITIASQRNEEDNYNFKTVRLQTYMIHDKNHEKYVIFREIFEDSTLANTRWLINPTAYDVIWS